MKILFLTFYFEPDLCAGSFRNSPLANILSSKLSNDDAVEVFTTIPNRYQSYNVNAPLKEKKGNMTIHRIRIASHENGFKDQIMSFWTYYREVLKLVRTKSFDIVYASSSRLFTAYLGFVIAKKKQCPLYLDIRDIFTENIKEILPPLAKAPLIGLLKNIERRVFSYANHINLVSKGFEDYFKRYDQATYSWFTNGIDDEFLNMETPDLDYSRTPLIVTYAGNLGEGQGLHNILPEVAGRLGDTHIFRIIGDGGRRRELEDATKMLNNVEIIQPVNREKLKEYYKESHFLFLHLNDYEAFRSVLPSKIFEYAATGRPILAGVSGFAADFLMSYLPDAKVFSPNDVMAFVTCLTGYKYATLNREEFITRFQRKSILCKMADSILSMPSN